MGIAVRARLAIHRASSAGRGFCPWEMGGNALPSRRADKERLAKLGSRLQEANLTGRMIFCVDVSRLGFDETVVGLSGSAGRHGWQIPATRGLHDQSHQSGLEGMTGCTILCFCNPQDGHPTFTSSDGNKALTVMIRMGVSL